jgi:hypothetical protein
MTTDWISDTQADTKHFYVSMRTKFVIRKDLRNTEGTTPVYLHITGLGQRERLNPALESVDGLTFSPVHILSLSALAP